MSKTGAFLWYFSEWNKYTCNNESVKILTVYALWDVSFLYRSWCIQNRDKCSFLVGLVLLVVFWGHLTLLFVHPDDESVFAAVEGLMLMIAVVIDAVDVLMGQADSLLAPPLKNIIVNKLIQM